MTRLPVRKLSLCPVIDSSCLSSIHINDDIDDITWDPSKSESYESIDDHIRDRRWSCLSYASTGVESLTDNNKQTDKVITSKEENDVDGGIDDHIRDRRWSFLSYASTGVESLRDIYKQTE